MMAYSATTAQDQNSNSDDSGSIFGSGGAISEALAESDPSLKDEEASKPKQPTEADIKKEKEEKEKKKKDAEKKKKEAEEKRKKEE